MFSIFGKKGIDTSTPDNFRRSILERSPTAAELHAPTVFNAWGKKGNQRAYMEVLEDLSMQGNVPCQEFVTQFYTMAASGLADQPAQEAMYRRALKFGELAAKSGVAREAINLPLTAVKLCGILMSKGDEKSIAEFHSKVAFAHEWHVRNSSDAMLTAAQRLNAAEQAKNLSDAFAGDDEENENENEDEDEDKDEEPEFFLAARIEAEGLDKVSDEVAHEMFRKMSGTGCMFEFVLAELDGASMGNEKSKRFARESGISAQEYKGAHLIEHPLIDGPDGAKTLMDAASLGLSDNPQLMVDFRLEVLDKVMRKIEVGRYNTD